MRRDDPNLPNLRAIAEAVGELRDRVVFVGGATAGLLLTDPAAEIVRATQDVDAIVEAELAGRGRYQHHPPLKQVTSPTEAPMATKTRTGSRASRTRATNPARPPVTKPVDRVYAGKVTVARTRVDVPMLVAERSPVILPGANRANVHALSTVAASILSYCACGPTNLM